MHNFYNVLIGTTRTLLDASVGSAFMSKSTNDAYQLLENMEVKNFQWLSEMVTPKKPTGIQERFKFRCSQSNSILPNYKVSKLWKM